MSFYRSQWGTEGDLQPADGAQPNHVAVDETVIQVNDQRYWLYAAVDPEQNRLLHVQLFPTRTQALTEMFLSELKEKHLVEDAVFLIDGAPWLQAACHRHGIRFQDVTHGNQNTVERVVKELKRRRTPLQSLQTRPARNRRNVAPIIRRLLESPNLNNAPYLTPGVFNIEGQKRLMDTIQFPYRSGSHLPLLHTIDESGAWTDRDLNVEYDYFIGMDESHEKLASNEVEFVGGTHISPYSERTRGDDWIHLGQTVDAVEFSLVTRPDSDISKVSDLAGKTVTTKSTHPALNKRLFLYQHGLDQEAGDVNVYRINDDETEYGVVRDNKADAALVTPTTDLVAEREGLRVIKLGRLPMVRGTTVSTTRSFSEANPDITKRFIKGMIEGIAFFKNNREETIEIIREREDVDSEMAAHIYESFDRTLCPKLYPPPEAIANVYQEAIWWDEAAKEVEPFELWDFHYLRDIVDSGFINSLY